MNIGGREITKIVIFRHDGPDQITFTMDGPTPFPELDQQNPGGKYPPDLRIDLRKGYAEEWLEKTFGLTTSDPLVSVLDVPRAQLMPFSESRREVNKPSKRYK